MSANIHKTLDSNWQGKFIYYEKKRISRIRKISPLNIPICFEYGKRVWCIFHAPVPRNFYKSLVRTRLHDTFSTFSGQNKNTNVKKKLSRQPYCFVGKEIQNCLMFSIFRRNQCSSTAGFNTLLCSVSWLQSTHRVAIAAFWPFTVVSITYKVPVYAPADIHSPFFISTNQYTVCTICGLYTL
jgi:hypothetical protein